MTEPPADGLGVLMFRKYFDWIFDHIYPGIEAIEFKDGLYSLPSGPKEESQGRLIWHKTSIYRARLILDNDFQIGIGAEWIPADDMCINFSSNISPLNSHIEIRQSVCTMFFRWYGSEEKKLNEGGRPHAVNTLVHLQDGVNSRSILSEVNIPALQFCGFGIAKGAYPLIGALGRNPVTRMSSIRSFNEEARKYNEFVEVIKRNFGRYIMIVPPGGDEERISSARELCAREQEMPSFLVN